MSSGNTVRDGSGDPWWLLIDVQGRLIMVGPAAHDAPAVGSPLRVAGVYHSSDPTGADGDILDLLADVAGRLKIVGAAAEDAAAVGNPVLVAGRYDAAARALDDGDVGAPALDVAGRAEVVTNPGGRSIIQLSADGQIKAAGGTLHGLIITSVGVTANDTIIIKDGGVGGTERIRVTLAANETIRLLGIDATFATDIFSDETLAGAGTIYVTGIYT